MEGCGDRRALTVGACALNPLECNMPACICMIINCSLKQKIVPLLIIIIDSDLTSCTSKEVFALRRVDIHGAKTHENETPLARLPQ